MKPRVALIRGKFLNRYEMQFFEPLTRSFDITAFGSLTPFHDTFAFPVRKLPSPMDIPEFPYKMPIINRLFTDAHYLWGLEGALKGFDLVHTAETYYRYTQQCLDAKKNGSVKYVIATVLETIPFNNEGIHGRSGYKARARKELDHIIALSERAKNTLIKEGTDPKKITVIPHFIDTKRFQPENNWANRLGTKRQDLTILFTGRLEEYKGVLDILEALDYLDHDPDLSTYRLTMRFVGDGSLRNLLRRQSTHHGKIWHSTVESANYDQMPDIYRNADCYIAPSKVRSMTRFGKAIPTWEEQYGVALMEAQSMGLPIITTTSGAIPENVGDAAFLVPPGSPSALAVMLKKFIRTPKFRADFGIQARSRAVRVHDITIGTRKMKDLYDQVLGKSA